MPVYMLDEDIWFPPVDGAREDGLLAVGGDLKPRRLLLAYMYGIFPWYNNDSQILWWCPRERYVILPSEIHVSKSMKTASVSRVFHVAHSDAQIEEELNCIVDLGGCVKDVYVIHEVYGRIRGELEISSRRQVKNFLENIKNGVSSPLKNVTGGSHYHTVEAESEEILDEIARELKKRNMLLEDSL